MYVVLTRIEKRYTWSRYTVHKRKTGSRIWNTGCGNGCSNGSIHKLRVVATFVELSPNIGVGELACVVKTGLSTGAREVSEGCM
jgi:hypothetical protein